MHNVVSESGPLERESNIDVGSTMKGSSNAMVRLSELIAKVARSQRPVLVTGPTGSGKELVVRELHRQSSRSAGPFLDLNCAAIPDSLMEAQLFGHERGAFTGADRRREGYLAAVGEGTLFLDELAELGLTLQARLLRVLETRSYRRLGSVVSEEFRGRIVAATHADLDDRVRLGSFREDLLYRLNVLVVRVPSLDERREDIPELARHFAAAQSRDLIFSADALSLLSSAPWPGNIRQLRNTIDKLAVLAEEGPVTASVLRETLGLCAAPTTTITPIDALAARILKLDVNDKIAAIRNALVLEALRQSEGNKAQAARLLGVHRKVVERRLSDSQAPPVPRVDSDQPEPASAVDFDLLD
jgi:DNA-binding NtrC family response regulator